MSSPTEDLTWRFELLLRGQRWVPVTKDILDDEAAAFYSAHVGTQEMPCIWKDADEVAPDELGQVLVDLIEVGEPLGMSGARIVVWEGIGTDGDPALILEATPDELAVARLELANREVQNALQEVERARTRVRARIVKAANENRLSRNMIARAVNGALSRRLVLQYLAGHDLVEAVRDALQSWMGVSSAYQRWYDYDPYGLRDPDEEYLGPFCFGPVCLQLEASGQVYLHLVMPRDDDPPDIDFEDEEAFQTSERAFLEARAKFAQKHATEVLPLLAKAGFRLLRADNTPASVEDLAESVDSTHKRLLVSEDA